MDNFGSKLNENYIWMIICETFYLLSESFQSFGFP